MTILSTLFMFYITYWTKGKGLNRSIFDWPRKAFFIFSLFLIAIFTYIIDLIAGFPSKYFMIAFLLFELGMIEGAIGGWYVGIIWAVIIIIFGVIPIFLMFPHEYAIITLVGCILLIIPIIVGSVVGEKLIIYVAKMQYESIKNAISNNKIEDNLKSIYSAKIESILNVLYGDHGEYFDNRLAENIKDLKRSLG